tara:strand:+ start:3637 stop:4116 length:480 start_codon:yes stop_codon:yes gene_type:complete
MNSAQESHADITNELNVLNGTHNMNKDLVLNKLDATISNEITVSKTNTVEDIMKNKIESLESYLDSRVINMYQRPWNKLEAKLKIRKIEEYYNNPPVIIIEDVTKTKVTKTKKHKGVEALTNYSMKDTITFLQGYNSINKKIKVEYDVESCLITSLYII